VTDRFFEGFAAPREALVERSAIGTPEECVERIRAYVGAGCTKFVLWPVAPPDELVAQIEIFGREILPRFA
jgi:alkanesulfonate monooxygenase SsuD/methylene tetrahydromethanopterin reductase-like flavin-dependent oxidoreductase (luciferase family)